MGLKTTDRPRNRQSSNRNGWKRKFDAKLLKEKPSVQTKPVVSVTCHFCGAKTSSPKVITFPAKGYPWKVTKTGMGCEACQVVKALVPVLWLKARIAVRQQTARDLSLCPICNERRRDGEAMCGACDCEWQRLHPCENDDEVYRRATQFVWDWLKLHPASGKTADGSKPDTSVQQALTAYLNYPSPIQPEPEPAPTPAPAAEAEPLPTGGYYRATHDMRSIGQAIHRYEAERGRRPKFITLPPGTKNKLKREKVLGIPVLEHPAVTDCNVFLGDGPPDVIVPARGKLEGGRMMWYDTRLTTNLPDVIERAARYFFGKYGKQPTTVWINPFDEAQAQLPFAERKFKMLNDSRVLRNHLMLSAEGS